MKTVLLVIAFLCLAVFSFMVIAGEDSRGATTCRYATICQYEGSISNLKFDFGSGLEIILPVYGKIIIKNVEIVASGKETIIITSTKRYNYSARFVGTASGENPKYNSVTVCTTDGLALPIGLVWGTLNESFIIEGNVPKDPNDVITPGDVDLFFRATLSIRKTETGEVFTFPISMKLKSRNLLFIR